MRPQRLVSVTASLLMIAARAAAQAPDAAIDLSAPPVTTVTGTPSTAAPVAAPAPLVGPGPATAPDASSETAAPSADVPAPPPGITHALAPPPSYWRVLPPIAPQATSQRTDTERPAVLAGAYSAPRIIYDGGASAAPSRALRVFVEAASAALGGTTLGALGFIAGCALDGDDGGDFGCVDGAAVGLVGGATAGVALGTYISGNLLDGNGGFGWTLLGTAGGIASVMVVAPILDDADSVAALALLLPIAGSILGYELSSDASRTATETGTRTRASLSLLPGGAAVGLSGQL